MKRIICLMAAAVLLLAGVANAAPSFVFSTYTRSYLAGTGNLNALISEGQLILYDGTAPGPNSAPNGTALSTHALPASGSNSVANGVITVGTIANVNASQTGTAQYFRILTNGGANVVAEGNVGISGATVTINTPAIVQNGPVAVTGLTITVPAGT